MKQAEIIARLRDLRESQSEFAKTNGDEIYKRDVEALDAAIEALERIRWRKVGEETPKDGLPEEGEVILTRDKYGHLRDRTLKRVGKTMLFTPDGMEPIRHITHWMPLPGLPGGENDG